MLIKTRGIVFRTVKYGETSIITDIFTEQLGLRTYIVNGVRKPKSRMSASFFQIATLLDLVVYEKDQKKLQRIKEVGTSKMYQKIPYSVIRGAVSQFILEVTRKSIKEKEQNTQLFNFLYLAFSQLDELPKDEPNFHLNFLLELPQYIGFSLQSTSQPDPYYLDIKEGTFSKQFNNPSYQINNQHSSWINSLLKKEPISINATQRKDLIDNLLLYYKYHIEGFGKVNAHDVLADIFH